MLSLGCLSDVENSFLKIWHSIANGSMMFVVGSGSDEPVYALSIDDEYRA